ncbi:MAG: META domain-containing protein, partial [Chitinophagaceae bacterium]
MRLLFSISFFAILFSACTGSSPSASSETENPTLKADSAETYYNPDYKMPPKTSWVLLRINGQEFAHAKLRGEGPTMEIDLTEGKVRGTGGCNRYNAPVTIEGDKINFGQIMSTKVNCPSIGVEQRFFGVLNFGLLTYEWSPGRLVIQRDARAV